MALFKILQGLKANLPEAKTEGYCWYTIDDSMFYIDYKDENGMIQRKPLNANDAQTLSGKTLAEILASGELALENAKAYTDSEIAKLADGIPTKVSELTNDAGYLTSYTETDPTVPDWAKADTKPDYNWNEIEDRPIVINGGDTLTWDGDMTGKIIASASGSASEGADADLFFVLISNATPSYQDLCENLGTIGLFGGAMNYDWTTSDLTIYSDGAVIDIARNCFVIHTEGVTQGELTFPKKGVYFPTSDEGYIGYLTINNYTGFTTELIDGVKVNYDNTATDMTATTMQEAADQLYGLITDHTGNEEIHITTEERASWKNAEKNQNAFSSFVVGSTTVAADTTTDSLTLIAGDNVTLTADATNDKITIAAKDTTYTALKNPNKLTIKGAGVSAESYDGSAVGEVDIVAGDNITVTGADGKITIAAKDTTYTSLKNPNALTVGNKTYDGSSAVSITASDLGLASAMKYLGTTTTAISDSSTTNPITIDSASITATTGNVVCYGSKEFVWKESGAWEELGNEGSYKVVQTAVTSPSTSGDATAFIDTITQDTNGKITATKKNVTFPTLSGGAGATSDTTVTGGVTVDGHAVTVAKKTLTAGDNVTITGGTDKITIAAKDTTYSNFVKSGTGAAAGLVPAPSTTAGTTKFLCEDGTWAVPTDTNTKVTAVGNHYTPAADTSAALAADASSTTAATWGTTSLVTGVNLQRDAKGHVTGVTVDSIKMPANPDTDTKNTAGSTDTSSKIYLIGATSQAANPQTYSHDTAYVGADGCVYSGGSKVLTAHPTITTGTDTTSTSDLEHGQTFTTVDSITRDSNGHVTTINTKTVSIPDAGLHFIPDDSLSVTAGSSTSGEYLAAQWSVADVDGITAPHDGMSVSLRTPAAGYSGGILLSIDGGTTFYPIVRNVNTLVTTNYAAGSTIILTFNSTQTAKPYVTANTATTVTGCWQVADYDANTRNTVGDYRKNGTKLYFVGTTSSDSATSSSYATSYTNNNIYVNTSNVLYSAQGFSGNLTGDVTGNADTADALNISAGSATQPIYFSDGKPVATTYALNKTVPSDAVFTDTTYSTFVKSGSGAAAGLVPAPSTTAGTTKYLREDGTWAVPPDTNTTYSLSSFGITSTSTELNYTDGVTSNIQTQLNAKQSKTIGITSVTSSITLSSAHLAQHLYCTNSSDITITVPSGLGAGFNCTIDRFGAGGVTIAVSGTTINGASTSLSLGDQYESAVSVIALTDTVYSVKGGLA